MRTLLHDLRHGARVLLRRPGFTLVAAVTLALGIGANTAIFSVVNGVLLRPLPYPEPERLLTARQNISLPNLEDIEAAQQSFELVGGAVLQPLDFTGGGEPVQVEAALCTHELFDLLGARPAAGRTLRAEDDAYDAPRVVVLSHGFWQRHLGGRDINEGLTITLSGQTYAVVGVLPASFVSPYGSPDVWASLRVANPVAARVRGVHFLRTFWRPRAGVTTEQAQAELDLIARRLAEAYPDENKGRRFVLMSLHERMVGDVRPALFVLFGAVGMVLLIACANFANLLLARAATRRHEVAVRAALGAGRWRIARQLLTESVLLAVLGGAGGLVLALWGVDLLLALEPESLPRLSSIRVDAAVLLFTFGLAVLTGLVFGLAPALGASRANLSDALKEGGRRLSGGGSRRGLRGALVVAELAVALVLLVCAGLLIKGFWRLRAVEPGFETANLLTLRLELPEARYREIPPQTEYRRRVLEALNTLGGARAAMVSEIPLGGSSLHHNFVIEGRAPLAPGEEPDLYTRSVEGDYFGVMGIPVIEGRGLTPHDDERAPLVGVVNERFVREHFGGASPVGARIRWARQTEPQWITVVGVVGDVRHFGLDQPEESAVYTPYAQSGMAWKRWMGVVVRSGTDAAALTNAVKEKIWSVDPQVPVTKVRTMEEVSAASVGRQRLNMTLLALFAAVALALASVGIYGVINYTVAQRTHEIGIRMALGARRRDVLAMVLRQGLGFALAGAGIGLLLALALTRLLASLLYGVTATDPSVYALVAALLVAVALLACYVPARRATRVDPMEALRYE
ncbi:MAG TPA: ABC transporter permease [Pyrinomonadaceae bacterium]|nr:ABC transporter permease [Pyrinomonadaceae bacterium]